jgi:hypothetical protein
MRRSARKSRFTFFGVSLGGARPRLFLRRRRCQNRRGGGLVDDFCEATADLDEAEVEAFEEYDEVWLNEEGGEEVSDALNDYLDAYEDALNEYLEEVETLGQPDIKDGEEIVNAVRQFVEEELEVVEEAREELEDLNEEGDDLASAADDIFLEMDFTDFLPILEDAESDEADEIAELIEDDEVCATFLFQS